MRAPGITAQITHKMNRPFLLTVMALVDMMQIQGQSSPAGLDALNSCFHTYLELVSTQGITYYPSLITRGSGLGR